uniref:Paralemmin-1 n=1 Tax=Salarias fasciatus TaxID=181472 RepID=A0A672FWU1_SALFA
VLFRATYQDRMLLLAERRKLQTEMENKKQQLEDDRRELQHLKSKALRERWLLDSGPPSGPGQDQDQDQDQNQDQARTRSLEETILTVQVGVGCRGDGPVAMVTPLFLPPVVHEVDGLGGSAPLSSAQVDQLLLQADRVAMATPPEEEEGAGPPPEVGGASEETPVTMVFLGYQSVEEEEEEEEERGGAVRAELVLLEGEATTPTDKEKSPCRCCSIM